MKMEKTNLLDWQKALREGRRICSGAVSATLAGRLHVSAL